jgi:hypothetical protein
MTMDKYGVIQCLYGYRYVYSHTRTVFLISLTRMMATAQAYAPLSKEGDDLHNNQPNRSYKIAVLLCTSR